MINLHLLQSRIFIKINACIIGYILWLMLAGYQTIHRTIQAPVCFYNLSDEYTITAPTTVQLSLRSTRKNLEKFDVINSAIHVNAAHFTQGNHMILLDKENLFLPEEIKLVNLRPSSLSIQLQKNE